MFDLAAIPAMSLEQIRDLWRSRYGRPPSLRSPEILGLMFSYRFQAEIEGGLEPELRRVLRQSTASKGKTPFTPGTCLSREWQGIRHEVLVQPDGRFRWHDADFRSLSEVARAITGSRWNGPRFFGLREAP
jgi:hypothetical protein